MPAHLASHGTEADEPAKALPGGRPWLYFRGFCLAYLWVVGILCLAYAWPGCPSIVRDVAAGLGCLATMAVLLGPQASLSPGRPKRPRYAASGAVVLAHTIVGVRVLSSSAPSRLGAYAGTVLACGIVLCGVNGLASGRSAIGNRRAVGCGVALTVLSLAASMLPDVWFQLVVWSGILAAQLPILVGWPATGRRTVKTVPPSRSGNSLP